MQLCKSRNTHSVRCQSGHYVVYNTLLNAPMLLDDASYSFLQSLPQTIGEDDVDGEEAKDFVAALLDSGLLVPNAEFERAEVAAANSAHLERLETGSTLRYIDLRVSELCNFGCRHCISARARSSALMGTDVAQDALVHILGVISEANGGLQHIDVHYGNAEPLINLPTIQAAQRVLNAMYGDIPRTVSLNTNLSLLDEATADYLLSESIHIYASLDGPQPANDAIRVFKNGRGTYHRIMAGMDLLRHKGQAIEGVSITITDENYALLDADLCAWCRAQGFKSLAIDFDLINPVSVPVPDRVAFLTGLWCDCAAHGIECFGTWLTPFLNLSNRVLTDEHYSFCRGVHGDAVSVSPDGLMYICGSSTTPLGHYSALSESLRPGGPLHEVVRSHLVGQVPRCRGCSIEGACSGQCHVTCEYSAAKQEEQCELYRSVTESLLVAQASCDAAGMA